MYELVVIWSTGETETHPFETEEEAKRIGDGMKNAFGDQIEWYGTRKKRGE